MKFLAFFLFVFLILSSLSGDSDYWRTEKYADLLAELKKAGFSEAEIDSLFSDPRVEFYLKITKKKAAVPNLIDPKYGLLLEKSVTEGKKFIEKNREILERVEKEYGVDKEIIVAILKIESDLGRNRGSYQAFSALNSIIFYSKADSRQSKWAKKQMVAFLIICRRLNIDPFEIKSSWAGAIGIPQFLPTSYLAFAVDGNNDGKIDLFNLEDALFSIANYLVEQGWKKDKSKAIYAYNHSWNYVKAVEVYAKKIGAD